MANVQAEIQAAGDDGCWYSGGTSQPVFIGSHPAVGALNAWFRFALDWTFLKGATINSAILRLKATANENSAGIVESVMFEDADNPAAITSDADGDGRSKTTGVVWNIGDWTAGASVDSPDLKSILQGIANRPGLSGAIQVFAMNTGGSSATRQPYDFFHGQTHSAKLILDYTVARRGRGGGLSGMSGMSGMTCP